MVENFKFCMYVYTLIPYHKLKAQLLITMIVVIEEWQSSPLYRGFTYVVPAPVMNELGSGSAWWPGNLYTLSNVTIIYGKYVV